jgi:Fe-S-cluster containining protein
MGFYLRPGLTVEGAGDICMRECRAQCCRGPLVLELTGPEASELEGLARGLGINAGITPASQGGGWIRFADHAGERCPFLDGDTFACRIYAHRPGRCRAFPERPTPGCAISGGG